MHSLTLTPVSIRKHIRIAAALAVAILMSGCASRPDWPVNQLSTSTPPRQLLEETPFYPQEQYQCGPASLAMMLNAQGLSTHPEVLKDLVYLPGRDGSLQVEMVAGARAHDMVVYRLPDDPGAILEEIDAGHPVLVMQNLRLNWWPKWHFAVVVGYDQEKRVFILNTDTRQRYEMAYEVFHNTWARAGQWAVVVLPPDQLPATAQLLPYLRSAHDLETTGHTHTARQAYQSAATRWPDQAAPVMAEANLDYSLGNLSAAKNGFLEVVQQFPEFPEGWNNLAITLKEAGCDSQAARASQCASQLAPERFPQPEGEIDKNASSERACPALPACPLIKD